MSENALNNHSDLVWKIAELLRGTYRPPQYRRVMIPMKVEDTIHKKLGITFQQQGKVTKGRSYTLSAGLYQALGDKAAYTRQVGFSSLQNEQLVLNYVAQHGQISRSEAMELCRLSEGQAKALLKKLTQAKQLQMKGAGSASFYIKSDEIG